MTKLISVPANQLQPLMDCMLSRLQANPDFPACLSYRFQDLFDIAFAPEHLTFENVNYSTRGRASTFFKKYVKAELHDRTAVQFLRVDVQPEKGIDKRATYYLIQRAGQPGLSCPVMPLPESLKPALPVKKRPPTVVDYILPFPADCLEALLKRANAEGIHLNDYIIRLFRNDLLEKEKLAAPAMTRSEYLIAFQAFTSKLDSGPELESLAAWAHEFTLSELFNRVRDKGQAEFSAMPAHIKSYFAQDFFKWAYAGGRIAGHMVSFKHKASGRFYFLEKPASAPTQTEPEQTFEPGTALHELFKKD